MVIKVFEGRCVRYIWGNGLGAGLLVVIEPPIEKRSLKLMAKRPAEIWRPFVFIGI